MRLVWGGKLAKGDPVLLNGRRATVICVNFSSRVFEDEVSVRLDDGTAELVHREQLERPETPR